MNNRRIRQLALMLSDITHIGYNEAEAVIVDTKLGKEILENNVTVLYEQQTENLSEIADELKNNVEYKQLAAMLKTENIAKAAMNLSNLEQKSRVRLTLPYVMSSNKELKRSAKKKLLQKQKKNLALKNQNFVNVRRIENADKLKR